MAAYEVENEEQQQFVLKSIREGLRKFTEIFGFASLSTIAPNYTWNGKMEEVFYEEGIRYFQSGSVQLMPDLKTGRNQFKRHYTGEANKLDQIYTVRNCRFEPSSDPNRDWVESCLQEIQTSFLWKKPAIIETHRVNYIGYINSVNRDRNLKLLTRLIKEILNRWPDVEFMNSEDLGKRISNDIVK